jgi:(p)ppGpp synthase/HD superfamily hydrolase
MSAPQRKKEAGGGSPIALWQEAVSFAARHHCHQLRPDGITPYVAHPVRIALTILTLFQCDDAEVTAAALLHDVLEKTGATYDELATEFGTRVADMVSALSKDHRLPGEAAERAYLVQLQAADWKTRLIKLADVFDNLSDATPDDLPRRKKKARQALTLAAEPEPPLVLARQLLTEALAAAS